MELSFCGMPLDVTCGVATRYNEVSAFFLVNWFTVSICLTEAS